MYSFQMVKIIIQVCASLVILYGIACLALYFFQRSLIYFPQPNLYGSAAASQVVQVPDAKIYLTTAATTKTKALIYFGGNAEDVSAQLSALTTLLPDYALYLVHYRGYGASSGRPSEQALHQDALEVYKSVSARHTDIAVIGRSLGSGVAVRLASLRPITRLILVTPYDSIEALASQRYAVFPVGLLLKDKFESWRDAPQIKVPTAVFIAAHDQVIPHQHTQRLLTFFQSGMVTVSMIPNCDHNSIASQPQYLAQLRTALSSASSL
jgi:uncharacterized protein